MAFNSYDDYYNYVQEYLYFEEGYQTLVDDGLLIECEIYEDDEGLYSIPCLRPLNEYEFKHYQAEHI